MTSTVRTSKSMCASRLYILDGGGEIKTLKLNIENIK